MSTTARKVFDTPELLSIICAYSDNECLPRILCTNKSGFAVAVSLIWSHVDVVDLLKLLPTLLLFQQTKHGYTGSFGSNELDFERFELYAPVVKSIEIQRKIKLDIEDWTPLESAQTRRPLLPQLQSITFYGQPRPRAFIYVGWIKWLMSPSLTSITILPSQREVQRDADDRTFVSFMEMSTILQAITEGQPPPQLTKLTLPFCSFSGVHNNGETSLLLCWMKIRPPREYFPQLHSLRELEASASLLQPGTWPAVCNLQGLQRLKLYSVGDDLITESVELPPDAFPSLQHLSLSGVYEYELEAILDAIPVLERLVSFEMDGRGDMENEWLEVELLPRIGQMTSLVLLRLELEQNSMVDRQLDQAGSLVDFSVIPLEDVKLVGMLIVDWEVFVAMFPRVKRLDIPSNVAHLHQLAPFRELSRLEEMSISLVQYPTCPPYPGGDTGSSAFRTLVLADATDIIMNVELLFQTIETLFKIWPNIQQIKVHRDFHIQGFQLVSSLQYCLSIVRNMQDLKARIVAKCGQQAADDIAPQDFFDCTSVPPSSFFSL